MSLGRDLLILVEAGGELEMPRGLVNRLTDAGYAHPQGIEAMHDLLCEVAFDEDHEDVNAAAALALRAAGVRKA